MPNNVTPVNGNRIVTRWRHDGPRDLVAGLPVSRFVRMGKVLYDPNRAKIDEGQARPTNGEEPLRNLIKRILVATGAVIAALAIGTPAYAAPSVVRYSSAANGKCLQSTNASADDLTSLDECSSYSWNNWTVDLRGHSPSNHELVRLVSRYSDRCLDSHAGTIGDIPWAIGCNAGNYQLWEVFYNNNGTRTFKSWGAFANQGGLHLCLYADSYRPLLNTCDVNASRQQWIREDT